MPVKKDPVVGATIVEMRLMSPAEKQTAGFEDYHEMECLVLSTGALLFASRDEEGNGPGAFMFVHGTESYNLFLGSGDHPEGLVS